MSYAIFSAGTVRRCKDGTFAKKGKGEFATTVIGLKNARTQIEDTSDYIIYGGDDLKNFVPGHIPADIKQSRGTLINLDLQFFSRCRGAI